MGNLLNWIPVVIVGLVVGGCNYAASLPPLSVEVMSYLYVPLGISASGLFWWFSWSKYGWVK